MERQKILNPLTGRMVYADGVVAKSIPKMKKKVSVLEGAIQRKTTTKIAEKKEAVGKLSGAIKRTLAKKPEPKKVYGWEDLPDDIKVKISGIVKKNSSRFNEDRKGISVSGQAFLKKGDYISYVNQVLSDKDISYEVRMELRKDAMENIEENAGYGYGILVEAYSFDRKTKAFIKKIYNTNSEYVPVISDLGTKAVFIVPDWSGDFYYDMSGGYGGDGYEVLSDGTYMDSDELYARLKGVDGYEDDADARKIELFGNPNLIAKLKSGNSSSSSSGGGSSSSGSGGWNEPKYEEYVFERGSKEYNDMVKEWFADVNLKQKNKKAVQPLPDWDDENERFVRDSSSGSGSGSGSRSRSS